MTESISPTPPEPSAPPSEEPTSDESGSVIGRVVLIAVGGLLGIIALIFVLGLLLAQGDVERLAPIIQIARDLVIIMLALQGILIILALAVLIIQVAKLINLLQNEFKPILQNTQDTLKSAKGTIEFVGDNVTEPLMRASGFFAGMSVMVSDLFGIRRAIRPVDKPQANANDKTDQPEPSRE